MTRIADSVATMLTHTPIVDRRVSDDYHVRAQLINGACCAVEVYWVVTKEQNVPPLYHLEGGRSSDDTTDDIAQAELFLSGFVRFDGCSNLRFDEQDHVMLHFCGREHAVGVGTLLGHVYDVARELIGDGWFGD